MNKILFTSKKILAEILSEILNLNNELKEDELVTYSNWKVLIYDKVGERLIMPLFSVKQLRDFGITLFLNINVMKEPIQDTNAIYLCCPTEENIKLISKVIESYTFDIGIFEHFYFKDLTSQLYSSYYINFIDPVGRSGLELLAQTCLDYNCQSSVKSVIVFECKFLI